MALRMRAPRGVSCVEFGSRRAPLVLDESRTFNVPDDITVAEICTLAASEYVLIGGRASSPLSMLHS
jgi:hypothetical protein